jgi:hypothetical protein
MRVHPTCLFTSLFALAACGKGGVPVVEFDDVQDAEGVAAACEEHADRIVTETFRVEFEATEGQCPWGRDDNLEPAQGRLTARVEQRETIDLEDIVVCDMDFDFAGEAGMEQDLVYDDNFFFLFNGVVLAASYRPWVELLPAEDILRFYDWSALVGQENLFGDIPTYCLGDETDLADCEIPSPETLGPISLSFDLSITSTLSYRAIEEERLEFGFVATGDNDPSIDCAHDFFFFDVTLPYLPIDG